MPESMDPSPSFAHETRGRKRHRADSTCNHCRPGSARCSPPLNDSEGRCTNSIELEGECDRGEARNRATNARQQTPDTCERCLEEDRAILAANITMPWFDCNAASRKDDIHDSFTAATNFAAVGYTNTRQPQISTEVAHLSMKEALMDQTDESPETPGHYSDNERTRSQSPAHSFYHGDSPVPTPVLGVSDYLPRALEFTPPLPVVDANTVLSGETFPDPKHTTDCETYQYTPLCDNEIRLLRLTPGYFHSPLQCSLKVVPMEKITAVVHEFQALSYAWGNDPPSCKILLNDLAKVSGGSSTAPTQHLTYPIRKNLYQALKHIRLTDEYLWLWVDYLCIEQTNQEEKSQQIPKMPSIYSSAWNVIAWLGVDDKPGDVEEAVCLIPDILNLKEFNLNLRGARHDKDRFCYRWIAFGRILQRPWFRRRWVIQEVACARRLSVRIADKILSWLDFADAVDLYSDHLEQMRARYRNSTFYKQNLSEFDHIYTSEAVELMRFSRNVFQRSPDSTIASRLMTLESLVLTASSFAVSEVRDTVYALLYLASDMHGVTNTSSESQVQHVLTSDYSRNPVDIFKDFICYSITRSNSLDVLCRQWASWPHQQGASWDGYRAKFVPSWIGIAAVVDEGRRLPLRPRTRSASLLGPVGSPIYHASHGVTFYGHTIPPIMHNIIQLDGMALGIVELISDFPVHRGYLKNNLLRMLGWRGTLDKGIDDQLWRTIVANRNPDSKVAPTWYRRVCALALTQLNDLGDLNSRALIADSSQPNTLVDYLKRVQEATANRKIFRCKRPDRVVGLTVAQNRALENIVGLGPELMDSQHRDFVSILYGSSVPVILRVVDDDRSKTDSTYHVKLVGPCYAHGHMEGEMFAGMGETEIKNRTIKFSIH